MSINFVSRGDNGDWSIDQCDDEERNSIIAITKKILELHADPYLLDKWENLTYLEIAKKINRALKWDILKRVIDLDLSGRELTSFPDRVVYWVPNIETLDLSHNNLKKLPKTLSALSHLQRLNLANNPALNLEPRFFEKFRNCTFEAPFTIYISDDQQRMAEALTDLPRYCEIQFI